MRKVLQPMNVSAAEKQTVIDGDGWPIDLLHHAWNSWAVLGIRNIKIGHPVSHVMIDFLLTHRSSPQSNHRSQPTPRCHTQLWQLTERS